MHLLLSQLPRPIVLAAVAFASLPAPALFAGTPDKSVVAAGPPARPAVESRFDTDFNFSAPANFTGSVDAGKISSTSVRATFNETFNISQAFSARWLVGWEEYWFSAQNSSGIIPNRMMTVFAGIGAEFRFGSGWLVRADFVPGIASDFDDITWDDLVYNVRATVGYRFSKSLTVFAGVSVQPQFEFPVLPYVGAIWQINDKWKFNGTFPKASLEYALTDSWVLYGAGNFRAARFRTSDTLGQSSGDSSLNNQWLSYMDVQAGIGVAYKAGKHARFSVEAGSSLFRRFDYDEPDVAVNAGPAAYAGASMSFNF